MKRAWQKPLLDWPCSLPEVFLCQQVKTSYSSWSLGTLWGSGWGFSCFPLHSQTHRPMIFPKVPFIWRKGDTNVIFHNNFCARYAWVGGRGTFFLISPNLNHFLSLFCHTLASCCRDLDVTVSGRTMQLF